LSPIPSAERGAPCSLPAPLPTFKSLWSGARAEVHQWYGVPWWRGRNSFCRHHWMALWRLCWGWITVPGTARTFVSMQVRSRSASYTPPEVAQAYKSPPKPAEPGRPSGPRVRRGYRQVDLTAYFKTLGLAAPGITAISVNGGKKLRRRPAAPTGR